MISVAVAGATGYAGGELIRFLAGHPQVGSLVATASDASVGTQLASAHRNLAGHRFGSVEVAATTPGILAAADVAFLALPHGNSGAIAAQLPEQQLVIDCGADHRLADAGAWAEFYGSDTAHAGTWPYGLPELPGSRSELLGARRIAVPGCYPSAATLALLPALSAGLIEPGGISVVAVSGTSGAGKAAKTHLTVAELGGAVMPYSVGGTHRHTPEIEQNLSAVTDDQVRVVFTPVLAPMPRGILAVCQARTTEGVSPDGLREVYARMYGMERFVTVLPAEPEPVWPTTKATLGSNQVHVQVTVDPRTSTAIMCSAIDNLGKGTAGAAVQSMNIALGLPEDSGLTTIGVAP